MENRELVQFLYEYIKRVFLYSDLLLEGKELDIETVNKLKDCGKIKSTKETLNDLKYVIKEKFGVEID